MKLLVKIHKYMKSEKPQRIWAPQKTSSDAAFVSFSRFCTAKLIAQLTDTFKLK